jgi:hypothetical protein
MPAHVDIAGQRFGRLTAISCTGINQHRKQVWLFR